MKVVERGCSRTVVELGVLYWRSLYPTAAPVCFFITIQLSDSTHVAAKRFDHHTVVFVGGIMIQKAKGSSYRGSL